MATTSTQQLPEELLALVFALLETVPPSQLKLRQEPSVELIISPHQPLKDVSLVCRRWRRIVAPLLFKNARIRLDIAIRPEWRACAACGDGRTLRSDNLQATDDHGAADHLDVMTRVVQRLGIDCGLSILGLPISALHKEHSHAPAEEVATAVWAARFYHAVADFLHFIRQKSLETVIESCVVYTKPTLHGKRANFDYEKGPREWRYPAAAAMFHDLLNIISPRRIVLLAPPVDLACLTNATISTIGDWAFADMDYHVLELRLDQAAPAPVADEQGRNNLLPFPPQNTAAFAPSSIFHQRDWTHISLNEGSFLKAYGTYAYFEHGPPSIISSIKQCLCPTTSSQDLFQCPTPHRKICKSFTYTAIFPFADHADFAGWLNDVEILDLQLAPNPQSRILDDPHRRGHAQLEDCWIEVLRVYEGLVNKLDGNWIGAWHAPVGEKLRKLVCVDRSVPGLGEDLDRVFTRLCLPNWVEFTPGVFSRQVIDESGRVIEAARADDS